MPTTLTGKKVALLVANGFDENQMTEIQRALTKAKATLKTIAPEQGVVNGWQDNGWGHYFPVDVQINEALGSDFDMLVLPGGERGIAKLKANPHARRIIGHFLEAGKPVAAVGAGVGLLALSTRISGRMVAASADMQDDLKAAGAALSEEAQEVDTNLFTANGDDLEIWVVEAVEFFGAVEQIKEAA
jgi:protease I